jgi:hypothetical protein
VCQQLIYELLDIGVAGGFIYFVLVANRLNELRQAKWLSQQHPDTPSDTAQAKVRATGNAHHHGFAVHVSGDEIGVP